jgi:acetyl esterase/lipase
VVTAAWTGNTFSTSTRCTSAGSGLGKIRWVVERGFAWLHAFKRLRTRYERRADIHLPVGQSEEMAAACTRAGVAVELVRVPGAGHFFGDEDREQLITLGPDFLLYHVRQPMTPNVEATNLWTSAAWQER